MPPSTQSWCDVFFNKLGSTFMRVLKGLLCSVAALGWNQDLLPSYSLTA